MKTRRLFSGAVLALAALSIAAGPAPVAWNVDKPHSGIGFSVKHFFTPVNGQFDEYDIELTYDRENPANSSARVSINVASVNTGNEDRDAHLLSGDFFEADKYPFITFESESVRVLRQGELLLRGPLRIKGETRQIELPAKILGVKDIPEEMREMLGGVTEIASFEADLRLIRGDYGVGVGSWAANLVVGDEVDVNIVLEANRK